MSCSIWTRFPIKSHDWAHPHSMGPFFLSHLLGQPRSFDNDWLTFFVLHLNYLNGKSFLFGVLLSKHPPKSVWEIPSLYTFLGEMTKKISFCSDKICSNITILKLNIEYCSIFFFSLSSLFFIFYIFPFSFVWSHSCVCFK